MKPFKLIAFKSGVSLSPWIFHLRVFLQLHCCMLIDNITNLWLDSRAHLLDICLILKFCLDSQDHYSYPAFFFFFLIPGLGRSHGEGNCYSLQYSGLENSLGSQRVRHDWATFTFTCFYLLISALGLSCSSWASLYLWHSGFVALRHVRF